MRNPYFFGWLSSLTGRCWKWIRWSTPARLALSLAALIISPSISYPWISVATSRFIRSFASSTLSCHNSGSIRFVQVWAVNLRFIPGAMFAAIMAASMGKVPLPQKGSTRIRSPFQGVSISSAAARVSVTGALLTSVRYPRLCRESPEVSMATVTSSFIRNSRNGYSAPVSGNHSVWYFCFRRSTMAFFTTDWISEGLNSLLLMEDAFAAQNFPSSGI